MNLDIIRPLLHVGQNRSGNVPLPHHRHRQPHSQNVVCVFPENLPVGEVPPPSDYLTQNQSRHRGVHHKKGFLLFQPRIDKQSGKPANHAAVNGKPALPDIKNPKQIILIHVPVKNHIIDSCPDNGNNNGIKGKIPVHIRILTRHFRLMGGHQNPG